MYRLHTQKVGATRDAYINLMDQSPERRLTRNSATNPILKSNSSNTMAPRKRSEGGYNKTAVMPPNLNNSNNPILKTAKQIFSTGSKQQSPTNFNTKQGEWHIVQPQSLNERFMSIFFKQKHEQVQLRTDTKLAPHPQRTSKKYRHKIKGNPFLNQYVRPINNNDPRRNNRVASYQQPTLLKDGSIVVPSSNCKEAYRVSRTSNRTTKMKVVNGDSSLVVESLHLTNFKSPSGMFARNTVNPYSSLTFCQQLALHKANLTSQANSKYPESPGSKEKPHKRDSPYLGVGNYKGKTRSIKSAVNGSYRNRHGECRSSAEAKRKPDEHQVGRWITNEDSIQF